MKKILRWIWIVLGSLFGLVILVAVTLLLMGNSRIEKTYQIDVHPVIIPTESASLELGKHRVEVLCAGCHGPDLGGVVNWFSVGPLGTIDSANLTSGEGGVGQRYTSVTDYVRAIRHGTNPQGKPIYMPAVTALNHMSDHELGSVIAYIQSLPPVNRQTRGHRFTPLARIMLGAGMLGKLPVEAVDHTNQPSEPQPGETVAYGKYMVTISDCMTCHGENLAGGPYPDPTIKVTVPNLTPGGELATWTTADFVNTIRTGFTPGKRPLSPELMPWDYYKNATDEELTAMFLYLKSLPALPSQ